MNIDWAALGSVFGVSLIVTVSLVGLFTLGVIGLAPRRAPDGTQEDAAAASPVLARVTGYACFALCAAAVAYGIYLIVA